VTSVLLVHQPTDGGVGRHVEDLASGLSERGFKVVLCGPALPRGLTGKTAHVHLDLGRAVSVRSDLGAVARFARLIGEVRPDIVHAHSSKAGAVARLARLLHPHIPVVYTPHGYAFAGHFSRASERLAYLGVERALAPLASRVLCVSDAEAHLARSIGPGSRIRVVHNGVPPAHDGPLDRRIADLARIGPVIGALTLLRPGKGLETLIDALPRVLALQPAAQLALVGEGPDLDALGARARLRGVAHAVHFLGPTAEPLSAMRAMDVFVHPSWAESFPYVTLEAMSLGRPIVATNVGGVGEALSDGESALLIAPRDDAALAGALLDLLEHPDRRAQIGAAALNEVSLRFTQTLMIDRLAGVYDELVSLLPRPVPSADRPTELAPSQPPRAVPHAS
jgi:glycosyltransferase involved in cell wall biosynthesis